MTSMMMTGDKKEGKGMPVFEIRGDRARCVLGVLIYATFYIYIHCWGGLVC